jgi:dephospho-CoA kinase
VLKVGLTGGIATGKTRVRSRLAERGLVTFDLDTVAHDVVEPGRPAYDDIVRLFGPSVVATDGRIDRRVLAGIVFTDAAARADLNAIVHPRVFAEHDRLLAALPPDTRVVVTDATLLVESGYHLRFDRLVVTHCSSEQQRARLMARDGLTEEQAAARLAAQMPGQDKARYAHVLVDTSGAEDETDRAAETLARALRETAATRPRPVHLDPRRVAGCLARGPRSGPRGLSPVAVATIIAEAGVVPLPALARALDPPWTGPWYAAAAAATAGSGPEDLLGPVVLAALACHGDDSDYVLAAAFSTARLTHTQAEACAGALAFALALAEVHRSGALPRDLAERVRAQQGRIVRWAGVPVPEAVLARVERAGPVAEAGTMEAALVGLAQGLELDSVPADVRAGAVALARMRCV